MGDTWVCLVCCFRLLGALWESLSVLGRSVGVLGRHCAILEVSLGSPGAPQNVENELGSSSDASVAGNKIKTNCFCIDNARESNSGRSICGRRGAFFQLLDHHKSKLIVCFIDNARGSITGRSICGRRGAFFQFLEHHKSKLIVCFIDNARGSISGRSICGRRGAFFQFLEHLKYCSCLV